MRWLVRLQCRSVFRVTPVTFGVGGDLSEGLCFICGCGSYHESYCSIIANSSHLVINARRVTPDKQVAFATVQHVTLMVRVGGLVIATMSSFDLRDQSFPHS